jgi:hypothetical protein
MLLISIGHYVAHLFGANKYIIAQILTPNLGTGMALIFVVAMILLGGGLIEFLTEIQIAMGGRRMHREHFRGPRV